MVVFIMIDFANCTKAASTYGGTEKKKKIIYNSFTYLLKFPRSIKEKIGYHIQIYSFLNILAVI